MPDTRTGWVILRVDVKPHVLIYTRDTLGTALHVHRSRQEAQLIADTYNHVAEGTYEVCRAIVQVAPRTTGDEKR